MSKVIDWSEAPEWATGFGKTTQSGMTLWAGPSCYEYTDAYGGRRHPWAANPGELVRHRSEVEILERRPAPTRKTEVAAMVRVMEDAFGAGVCSYASALYDAGYRKFEIVDGGV